jgi:hypothetical protein
MDLIRILAGFRIRFWFKPNLDQFCLFGQIDFLMELNAKKNRSKQSISDFLIFKKILAKKTFLYK